MTMKIWKYFNYIAKQQKPCITTNDSAENKRDHLKTKVPAIENDHHIFWTAGGRDEPRSQPRVVVVVEPGKVGVPLSAGVYSDEPGGRTKVLPSFDGDIARKITRDVKRVI